MSHRVGILPLKVFTLQIAFLYYQTGQLLLDFLSFLFEDYIYSS